MSTIQDLKESISTMSDNALFSCLKDLRKARRTPVTNPTKTRKAKKKTNINPVLLVGKMTSEQKVQLLKELEELI